MKKILAVLLAAAMLSACGQTTQQTKEDTPSESTQSVAQQSSQEEESSAQTEDLSGHSLLVFSGAGMKKPFQEIADTFQEETGCEMMVTFANAAQIQMQINTAQEGDLFIAGSSEEVKPVQDAVTESRDLVKHIPVLTVQSGNPYQINGINDLAQDEIRVLFGDAHSTPIGKIGDKVLNDFGIMEQVNLVARTATAPAITMALAAGECDAAIVWKENADTEGIEIVDTPDMDNYIKTVPAASLSYSDDADALQAFLAYLDSDSAKSIWTKFGYEIID